MWYNLAAAKVKDDSLRQKAMEKRQDISYLMANAQIAEAQRLAAEWKAQTKIECRLAKKALKR
jgi:hypothetical protein